jgi:hypothetical protein
VALAKRKDALPYSNRLTSLHYDPERSRDFIFAVCKEWQARFGPKTYRFAPRRVTARLTAACASAWCPTAASIRWAI